MKEQGRETGAWGFLTLRQCLGSGGAGSRERRVLRKEAEKSFWPWDSQHWVSPCGQWERKGSDSLHSSQSQVPGVAGKRSRTEDLRNYLSRLPAQTSPISGGPLGHACCIMWDLKTGSMLAGEYEWRWTRSDLSWLRKCAISYALPCQVFFSLIRLHATLWTVTCQAPLSMGFSRQEYWSELPSSRGSSQPRDQTCIF